MILKGNQRSGGRSLAAHLANGRDNDHVELHELRGFASRDMLGAFLEIEAAAAGTRCKQPFFSVSMSPPAGINVNFDQYEQAAAAIEAKFKGLEHQPRAIVFHEKEGRRHAHVIWSRIDPERGRAVSLSHSRIKLRDVSQTLFQELGIDAPAGLKDRTKADPLNYDRPTWQQAKRLGEDPRDLKSIIRTAWSVSDNRVSFESALERHALFLARGDRRGYVIVHHTGEALSLTRYAGLKTKDIQARIGKPEQLQTLDQVQGVLRTRMTAAAEKRMAEMKQKHARELKPSRDKAAAMKAAHRAERETMQASQQKRRAGEDLTRANRLRKGIMGLWDRLSGKRGRVSAVNAREAAAGRVRDRDERQALVDRQMIARREVQGELNRFRERHKHERDYQRTELAVMLSMMKDRTREDFQEHGQDIDRAKNQTPSPGRDQYDDRSR